MRLSYGQYMDVSVSALRAELKQWIDRSRAGEDVVITERGVPVARLSRIGSADLIERLERDGLLTPPSGERVVADAVERPAGRAGTQVSGLVRRLRR